jgi:hypothetical protein
VAELAFSRRFLRELAEWEGNASPSDVALLDETLARIAENPSLPGRFPSFYEPATPSYLYRCETVLIHYRPRGDAVDFLNLFFERVGRR